MVTDSLTEEELLLSLTHTIRKGLTWQTFLSWYHSTLDYDPLYRGDSAQGDWTRKSLGFRVDWEQTPTARWTLALERYIRTRENASDAQGYGLSLWYARML